MEDGVAEEEAEREADKRMARRAEAESQLFARNMLVVLVIAWVWGLACGLNNMWWWTVGLV